jgi:uncharacterized protein
MTANEDSVMLYHVRHAESRLSRFYESFKIVLVTGARQVGKSTLLAHCLPEVKTVVFDPLQDLYGARRDPDMFLDNFPSPLILDEVQYAPELLPALKRRVDRSSRTGQYFLTGSQNLAVLSTVAESLAGRVGILKLEGMTLAELANQPRAQSWLGAYLGDPDSLLDSGTTVSGPLSRYIWRGGLPGLLELRDDVVTDYFSSYVQTYLERDIRTLADVRDLADFGRFLGLCSSFTAQEINDSKLGRKLGMSQTTARRWRDTLVHSYQWRELAPYHGNTIKRVSGKRKGLLCDTGLACYLQRVSSPEGLLASPYLGALFETWAINQIIGQFITLPIAPQAYHWRTSGGAEVDLILELDGYLHPIEIKCKTVLSGHDTRGLRAFRETYPGDRIKTGLIIYAGTELYRIGPQTIAVPWCLM